MKTPFLLILFFLSFTAAQAQKDASTFWQPTPRNYEVKQAIEVESLFPMFFCMGAIILLLGIDIKNSE